MKRFSNKTLAATVISVAACSFSMSVMATNGILPLGNGMIAHGVGGAGIANASEAMSGVDNPALLADTGNQSSVGASLFSPIRSADAGSGYVESGAELFLIPQGAWTTKIDDKMNWGVLVSVLGGMSTEYPDALFGQKTGMDLGGIIVAPTVSYKPNKKSAVGVSLLFGYEMLETFGSGAVTPLGPLPDDRKDSATGFGVKLGFATEVSSGVNLGLMYQSEITMDEMDKHCAAMFASASDCALSMPPQFGVGIAVAANEQVTFVGDIMRVSWSDIAVFEELFGWKNQTIIKLGFEYKMDSSLALRAGFNHGESPIPDSVVQRNIFAPAVTEDHLTFGFTKSLGGNMDVSGYYAYIFENEQTQAGGPFSGAVKAKMNQHALGVGVNWKL